MSQLQLNKLTGLVKKRKTIGRGGSRGGTSGRGHKGQKARTGGYSKVRAAFEGGQMPLVRRLPKRGFNNTRFEKIVEIINLDTLERAFNAGEQITRDLLIQRGLIRGAKGAVIKVLGNGKLSKKLIIHADEASKSAIQAIEQVGGKVELNKEM